jgi:hypothetical protein
LELLAMIRRLWMRAKLRWLTHRANCTNKMYEWARSNGDEKLASELKLEVYRLDLARMDCFRVLHG